MRRVPKDPFSRFTAAGLLGQLSDSEYKYVADFKEEITGYNASVELPYSFLRISAIPKYLNLSEAHCLIAPIISMTHTRIFWSFIFFDLIGWNERTQKGKIEWQTEDKPLKGADSPNKIIEQISSRFIDFIEAPIRSRWEQANKEQNEPQPASIPDEAKRNPG